MIRFLLRVIRKLSHIGNVLLNRGAIFASRIENKSSRMILGTDYSLKVRNEVPVEEQIFNALRYITPINPSLPAVERPAMVNLLVPSLVSRGFYGGIATALIFAGKLAERKGLPLRVVQTSEPGDGKGAEEFLKDNGVKLSGIHVMDVSGRAFNFYGYLDLRPDDIYIASAWWDAYLLEQLPLTHRFIYLIQDHEPIFYANGDMSVLAEGTYHSERFIPVCNTRLMYEFMSDEGYSYIKREGLWFEPSVSRLESGKAVENRGKRIVFLYGRPSVERNLFHLSLMALNQVFDGETLRPADWQVFMAGQEDLPDIKLSSGLKIQNLGKMSLSDYIKFSKTVDIAISPMMAPHPNYPTLEFASIGTAVVTTRYKSKQSLERYSPNIIMTDLSVSSLAAGIKQAAATTYTERIARLSQNHILGNWDTSFAAAMKGLDKALKANNSHSEQPQSAPLVESAAPNQTP